MRLRSVLLAVLVSLTPLAITSPASAEWGTATLQGTVTDAVTGAPLANIDVNAYMDGGPSAYARTDANGHYEIGARDAGSYTVSFSSPWNDVLHRTEWNADKPDQETADRVTLTDLETVTVDAALTPVPVISGRVTDTSGLPVVGVCPSFVLGDPARGDARTGPCTDADGRYRYGISQPGTYRVQFKDDGGTHAQQWYAGATTAGKATPITVNDADVTSIDAVLRPASSITSTLRAQDGRLLRGCVNAYDADGSFAASACTPYDETEGPVGPVTLRGLAAGAYRLLSQSFDRHYLSRYSGGAITLPKAKSVTVAVGQTLTTADMVLPLSARFTGRIVDAATGEPLRFVCATTTTADARAGGAADGSPGVGCADADGMFEVLGVEAGTYPIQISDPYAGPYTSFFFPHASDARSGTQYKVKLGQNVSLGTIRMVQGGSASVDVVSSSGEPSEFACLIALSARTAEPIGNTGCTYGSGPAQLTGLPTGDVLLYAYDVPAGSRPTYFPSSATLRGAKAVHVTEGQTLEGIRVVLSAG